jgi:hypothetical protein
MVKQQNFTIVNAHVSLNLLVFFMSLLIMHKAKSSNKVHPKLKESEKPNLKLFAF